MLTGSLLPQWHLNAIIENRLKVIRTLFKCRIPREESKANFQVSKDIESEIVLFCFRSEEVFVCLKYHVLLKLLK